jgi:hypothetical protein
VRLAGPETEPGEDERGEHEQMPHGLQRGARYGCG